MVVMKASQRRKELLTMIQEKGGLSLKEITEQFDVSKMTIHRDLDVLESRGLIRRIFGGAVPAEEIKTPTPAVAPPPSPLRGSSSAHPLDSCLVCLRPVTQHLLYGITLATGEQYFACCPHCGLSAHLRHRENITSAMTADFLSGRPHPAHRSFYLMGSTAAPCCTPSILTFENEDQARRFQTGFGGKVGPLQEALEYLQDEMSMDGGKKGCPHCATQG
jgi:DeoR family transcriptional regulator, copper-sensing transcriptional repressor